MANPLLQSIRSAVRANQKTADLFDSLGTKDAPNGVITSAYRQARRAMETVLADQNPVLGAKQVFGELRTSIQNGVTPVFRESYDYGIDEATRQLGYYDVAEIISDLNRENEMTQNAINVLINELTAQESAIMAILLAELDSSRIVGDEDHNGLLVPGGVLGAAIFWVTALLWDAFSSTVNLTVPDLRYKKQAVAVLDRRTTDCCLRVHGQIVPFDGEFTLTGHPAFADKIDFSPFHWYCRTSIVLYSERFDSGLTERMRKAADYVLSQRAQGIVFDQKPADAFIKIP